MAPILPLQSQIPFSVWCLYYYIHLFMDTVCRLSLKQLCSYFLSMATTALQYPLSIIFSAFVSLIDASISLYFRYCGLVPRTVDLDDQTYMHFWAANNPSPNKPNLVIIHGYGADSKWQFMNQVGPLSKCFNLYAPDLVFFGKSYSNRPDRTDVFQAKCVAAGLKILGVTKCSVYGISYGGFVGYRMAGMYPQVVEKIVIASSGITCTKEQKAARLSTVDRNFTDILLPQNPEDLRFLVNLSFGKSDPFKWVPDVFVQQFINVLGKGHVREKKELAEHLLEIAGDRELPDISQETLLVWGDKDRVFPIEFGYDLQRKLGPKAKLEVLKDAGHALNMESADELNSHIKGFILGSSKQPGSKDFKNM